MLSEEQMLFVEQYAQAALQLAQQTGDQKIFAKSLTSLGLLHQTRGNLQEANRHMEESLQISRREGYRDSLAQNLLWLNVQTHWQGNFQRASALCQESLAVFRADHDGYHELMSLAFLCLEHGSLGNYAQAFNVLHEGITKAKERENIYFLGRLTNSRGWLHSELRDIQRALQYDQESADMGRTHGIPNVEISALINIGLDYLALGQYERALSYLSRPSSGSNVKRLVLTDGGGRSGSSSGLRSLPIPRERMSKHCAMLKRDSEKHRRRRRRSMSPKPGPCAVRLRQS